MGQRGASVWKRLDAWVKENGNTTLFVVAVSLAGSIYTRDKRMESHAIADEVNGRAWAKQVAELEQRQGQVEAGFSALQNGVATVNGKLEILIKMIERAEKGRN